MSMGKRFYALLLAVAMILGMIPAGVFAEDVQATPLTLDQELSVEIAEAQASVWLSFTPEETGSYIFRSVAEEDTTAVLYDENKEYLSENDDSGRESNFSLAYTLEKGKTYYYEVSFYNDETGTIPVKVYPNPIKSIVEARAYIYENIHGDWVTTSTENGQEIEYFQYDYTNTPTLGYTVKFTDGTLKETGGADFEHDGEYYEIRSLDEQCSDNQWEGGKTYTGQIGVAGVFGDVEVHIEKFPAKSLELNPITIEENTWGYHDTFTNPETGEEESYFYYTWNEKVSGTIIFEDDSTTEVSCGGFGHYDVWLDLPVKDKQGRSESWTLGNTYEGIVTCGALEVTVPITIVEAEDPGPEPDPEEPEDLNAIPLTLDEETTAQITEPDGAVWFSFTPAQSGVYNFTSFASKDVYANLYDEELNHLAEDDDGGEENNFLLSYHMEAGKTYYFRVCFWSSQNTGEIPVKIFSSPIKSLSNAKATVVEYVDGWWDEGYDEENNRDVPYFYYEYLENVTCTVTFADNSIMEVEGEYFEYDGLEYYIGQTDDQDWNNQWTGGNTYTGQLEISGVSCDVAVTVVELPIKSAQIEPISIIEGQSLQEEEIFDSETQEWVTYTAYDWSDYLTGTVTMEDNSTMEIDGNWAYSEDMEIRLFTEDDQSNTVTWTAGNTYNAKVRVGDLELTVPVSIVASPVEKIEAQPITLYGDIDASFVVDGENGDGVLEYYVYYWEDKLQITVTFADGSTYTTQPGQGFVEYGGQTYWITTDDNQTHEVHWQIGQTNTCTVSVLGKEITVPVTVGPAVFQKIELGGITIQEGDEGYIESDWDDETGEEKRYFRYEWQYLLDGYTVTYADGTVESGSLTELDYMNSDYSFDFYDKQSADTPWSGGNTYDCQVRFGTHLIDVKVTIAPSPVKSVEIQPIVMAENDEEEYYWQDHLQYVITMQDGTKVMGDPNGFWYQGEQKWAETDDDQYEEPWGIGSHTGTVMILGKTYDVPVYIGKKVDSGKYSYVLYENEAYICDSRVGNASLTIPTTLDGKSVVGVLNLGADLAKATQVTIPNQITYLDPDAFFGRDIAVIKKLTLGTGVKYFTAYTMYSTDIESVTVNSGNAYYYSTDGVVYNKAKTALVFYPWAKSDSHTILNTVTDIHALIEERASIKNLDVTLGTGTKDQYVQENGIVFTKDKKTLVFCNSNKTGSYTLPASVTKLGIGAFANTGFTSVTLHDGIKDLPPMVFYNCEALTSVNLPSELKGAVNYYAFYNCKSLKTITLPQGITSIDYYSFANSGLTTLRLPNTLVGIAGGVFLGTPLKDVYYDGTREQWAQVHVSEMGNDPLFDATMHFKGEGLSGDADDNGTLNSDDAVYALLSIMFGTEDYPVPAGTNLDYDANGEVNSDDAVYLLLHAMFGEEDYPLYG